MFICVSQRWEPEVGASGGEAAFSSCMCKYQAAALLHLDKSSDGYRGDVMLMRAKTGTLASNPDDVVLSSRSLSQMHVYPLFLKKFCNSCNPEFHRDN